MSGIADLLYLSVYDLFTAYLHITYFTYLPEICSLSFFDLIASSELKYKSKGVVLSSIWCVYVRKVAVPCPCAFWICLSHLVDFWPCYNMPYQIIF